MSSYHLGMGGLSFSSGELLFLGGIALVLAILVAGYMIYTRRKGWM